MKFKGFRSGNQTGDFLCVIQPFRFMLVLRRMMRGPVKILDSLICQKRYLFLIKCVGFSWYFEDCSYLNFFGEITKSATKDQHSVQLAK
jgi:hypothetical protein